MNQGILIPLFALFIWLMTMFAENKFAYFYQKKDATVHARGKSKLSSFLIRNNTSIKYYGLGILWSGFSIATVLSDKGPGIISYIFYTFGIIGLAIYIISRIWPFLK